MPGLSRVKPEQRIFVKDRHFTIRFVQTTHQGWQETAPGGEHSEPQDRREQFRPLVRAGDDRRVVNHQRRQVLHKGFGRMLPRRVAPVWAVMIDAVAVKRAGEEVSEPAPRSQSCSDRGIIWPLALQPPREQVMEQVEQRGNVGLVCGAWRVIGDLQLRTHVVPQLLPQSRLQSLPSEQQRRTEECGHAPRNVEHSQHR